VAEHFVYIYRSRSGAIKYVGYGAEVSRAMSHSGGSHNDHLREWLAEGKFDLNIAGSYRDEQEGKAVEAALISALSPEFNRSPGQGPKFVPVGVPPELGDRQSLEPLTASDIGLLCGGALIVYLAPGDFLKDGRRKFDPATPLDADVVSNVEGMWDLGKHIKDWAAAPAEAPQVVVGVHGRNPKHRFIVGALAIDGSQWAQEEFFVKDRNRWRVPLQDPSNLDVAELRGRRVSDIKFGQFSWQLHQWIDADGVQKHP
jgi:hypothetical protein